MRTVIDLRGLQSLVDVLVDSGYDVLAPSVRNGVVDVVPVTSIEALPRGVHDAQQPGSYRLVDGDDTLFGFATTATSWKRFLFPPRRALWRVDGDGSPAAAPVDIAKRALLGVRACDLAALAVLDRALAARAVVDPDYVERRRNSFLVAVACARPAATCFCTSWGTGPAPSTGFDLALTEIVSADRHVFLVEIGSSAGRDLLERVPTTAVTPDLQSAADAVTAAAVQRIERFVDAGGIRDVLYDNPEHPRWDDVAARCLACASCTLVCPTCFCVATEEVADLTGLRGRDQAWDSCFVPAHSLLHGGPVHGTTRSRYRQWLTHKFAAWIDQFGEPGCVGCGRCITWCPAAIDVTEELAAIGRDPGERR